MEESKILVCPKCSSDEVLTASIQTWEVNTGEYWSESVKPSDWDSPATCTNCWWEGKRHQLIEKE